MENNNSLNKNYYKNNAPLSLYLLNKYRKSEKEYTFDDLADSIGVFLGEINDEIQKGVERFSEMPEGWSDIVKCLSCGRGVTIRQEKLNTMFSCRCGQKIAIIVPEEKL